MEGKIRVVQLNKYYAPLTGGIEKVVQDIAENLRDEVQMQVCVCNESNKKVDEVYNDVSVSRSARAIQAGSMPISLAYLSHVKKALSKADLAILHMPFPLGDLALRLSGYKGKVMLWWHSDIVRQKKLVRLYRPLMEWTLRRADVIAVATKGHIDGSQFINKYRDKCRIIPFAVDREIFSDGRQYLENRTEDAEHPVRFLFVGRLVYYKGCDVLLKAFADMRDKTARLVIIGNGPLLDDLQKQAAELGVAERVCFAGGVDNAELKRNLRECDVFVLPSVARSEAFGLVQMEAMAYGKPVINTDLPSGVPFVSLDGITGLTVNPSDPAALSEAMDILAENREMRAGFGKNARERVEKEYDMDVMMGRVLNIIKGLCDNGSAEESSHYGNEK